MYTWGVSIYVYNYTWFNTFLEYSRKYVCNILHNMTIEDEQYNYQSYVDYYIVKNDFSTIKVS